jgi:hypothetical protein
MPRCLNRNDSADVDVEATPRRLEVAATPSSPGRAGPPMGVVQGRDEGGAFTRWRRGFAATGFAVRLQRSGQGPEAPVVNPLNASLPDQC